MVGRKSGRALSFLCGSVNWVNAPTRDAERALEQLSEVFRH